MAIHESRRVEFSERRDRLAESVLNYRLALELQPADHETLEHVQRLVRRLDERKARAKQQFDAAFGAGDLASARLHLATLRTLDPLDPRLQADDRRLEDALDEATRAALSGESAQGAEGRLEAVRRGLPG